MTGKTPCDALLPRAGDRGLDPGSPPGMTAVGDGNEPSSRASEAPTRDPTAKRPGLSIGPDSMLQRPRHGPGSARACGDGHDGFPGERSAVPGDGKTGPAIGRKPILHRPRTGSRVCVPQAGKAKRPPCVSHCSRRSRRDGRPLPGERFALRGDATASRQRPYAQPLTPSADAPIRPTRASHSQSVAPHAVVPRHMALAIQYLCAHMDSRDVISGRKPMGGPR